jgi:hypothetical protein
MIVIESLPVGKQKSGKHQIFAAPGQALTTGAANAARRP